MEDREVDFDDKVEEDDLEQGENVEERGFKVGELVIFWEGASVRGNRTDSGALSQPGGGVSVGGGVGYAERTV